MNGSAALAPTAAESDPLSWTTTLAPFSDRAWCIGANATGRPSMRAPPRSASSTRTNRWWSTGRTLDPPSNAPLAAPRSTAPTPPVAAPIIAPRRPPRPLLLSASARVVRTLGGREVLEPRGGVRLGRRGVEGAHNRAHAGADNAGDGDARLPQRLDGAEVRDARWAARRKHEAVLARGVLQRVETVTLPRTAAGAQRHGDREQREPSAHGHAGWPLQFRPTFITQNAEGTSPFASSVAFTSPSSRISQRTLPETLVSAPTRSVTRSLSLATTVGHRGSDAIAPRRRPAAPRPAARVHARVRR